MLDGLSVYNFTEKVVAPDMSEKDVFTLQTCQRNLYAFYGNKHHQFNQVSAAKVLSGQAAYEYLLEIVCGLQSKLVAENEIVSQFKQAYKEYSTQEKRCTKLMQVLEKILKDAKSIRSDYLLGLSQKTYSSIARKNLVNKYHAKEVLILGSGKMAEDLILQLKKKVKIFVSARNQEKLAKMVETYDVHPLEWFSPEMYSKYSHIANTIGCKKQVLFNEAFFNQWEKGHRRNHKLFLDLGSPSSIRTDMTLSEGVMRLEDIFNEGAVHETYKQEQLQQAREELSHLAQKRYQIFQKRREQLKS